MSDTNEWLQNHILDLQTAERIGFMVKGPASEVSLYNDGRVVVHKGTVEQPSISAKTEFVKALKTGDVITEGPNKDWVYCEGENVEPFLVAPNDAGVMRCQDAQELALRHNASLPSYAHAQAMYQARDVGSLAGTFNSSGAFPDGWYWMSPHSKTVSWGKRFSDGHEGYVRTYRYCSVRLVRTYSPT